MVVRPSAILTVVIAMSVLGSLGAAAEHDDAARMSAVQGWCTVADTPAVVSAIAATHGPVPSTPRPVTAYLLSIGVDVQPGATTGLLASERSPSTSMPGTLALPHIVTHSAQPNPQTSRPWPKRHPMLFGAIVGAVAGALVVHIAVDAEASPVGFYGGAGAGALVGWVVSR
jgi:hypothetical protein